MLQSVKTNRNVLQIHNTIVYVTIDIAIHNKYQCAIC